MRKYLQTVIENILPYFLVFIASIYRPTDPDLGWHLKYGEYFFEHLKPLRENIFSSQMSDFHWANISWGTDVISFWLYKNGGFLALTIGAASVITLTFFLFTKAFKLDYWGKAFTFPLLLYFLRPLNSHSFRGTLLSLSLLGFLVYILSRFEGKETKVIYFIPLVFLIWANIHGLFILGLGVFFLWQGFFLLKVILEKKFTAVFPYLKIFILVSVLSILATIIHPFSLGIYKDALLHFNNPLLKSIAEYLPPEELSQQWYNLFITAILAMVGVIALVFARAREKIPQIGVFVVLFVLSLWVKRYAWAMFYLLIQVLVPIINFIKPDSKKGTFFGATLIFLVLLPIVIALKRPFPQFKDMSWDVYCSTFGYCSPAGAETLRKYYLEGKTMTLYNWGGWLIWNYPDMKPSVDGRMHLWRDEKGYSGFEQDYYLEQNVTDIDASKYDVVFTATYKPIFLRLQDLASKGKWTLSYEDKTTAIFIRNK